MCADMLLLLSRAQKIQQTLGSAVRTFLAEVRMWGPVFISTHQRSLQPCGVFMCVDTAIRNYLKAKFVELQRRGTVSIDELTAQRRHLVFEVVWIEDGDH